MKYGLMTETDVKTLEASLDHVAGNFSGPLTVAEIGVREGNTSRGIADWMKAKNRLLDYWGFDNARDMSIELPFPGANLVIGDSAETFRNLMKRIHLLLIDGCHCVNHVMLDFLHFGPLVAAGGLVLFHDWDETMQGKPEHYQGHGPRNNPSFSIGVREAIDNLGLLTRAASWGLWAEAAERCNFGGFVVFERRPIVPNVRTFETKGAA